MSYYRSRYYPKRPVKSFQDLEVYQKTYGLAIEVVKYVAGYNQSSPASDRTGETVGQTGRLLAEVVKPIGTNLAKTVLAIPELIAAAHSVRFGQPGQAIRQLEKAMLYCNLAVVKLEKYRDLVNLTNNLDKEKQIALNKTNDGNKNRKSSYDFFEEQIKTYLKIRTKIMRLQKSWVKFIKFKQETNQNA